MILGGVFGFLLRKFRFASLSVFIQWIICLLLFFLGLELGLDEALLGRMGHIGIQASVITLLALLGSMVMAAQIHKLFFKKLEKTEADRETQRGGWGFLRGSMSIFLSFVAGLGCAQLGIINIGLWGGYIVTGLLYCLLFFVGIAVGKEAALFSSVRQYGFRFMILPLGTVVGTLTGAALAGWILPELSISESMAVGSGMGYYSLSSVLLSHSKSAELGSVALISNILRELATLFLAPLMVRTFGKLAPISAGGVTSMDITLPVIIRFSGKEYAALAIFHGAVLDPVVPLLVGILGI